MDDTTPDSRISRASRRARLASAGWAAPSTIVGIAAPAYAHSPGLPANYGLNANTAINPTEVEANPRACSYPASFTPDSNYVEITISFIGDDPTLSLIDRVEDQPRLNDWVATELTPSGVVLRAPGALTSTGGNTPSTGWYWNVPAAPGTITVDGRIVGAPLDQFDEGQQVGP